MTERRKRLGWENSRLSSLGMRRRFNKQSMVSLLCRFFFFIKEMCTSGTRVEVKLTFEVEILTVALKEREGVWSRRLRLQYARRKRAD